MRFRGRTTAIVSAVLVLAGGVLAAPAAATAAGRDAVHFIHASGDSFDDVYAGIVRENGADRTSAFFERRSKASVPDRTFPSLGSETLQTQRQEFAVAAAAAKKGAKRLAPASADQQFAPMAVPDAPYEGYAYNDGFSWQAHGLYSAGWCDEFSCWTESQIEYRYTTDPGEFGSRTSLNFNRTGSDLLNIVEITSSVYANGAQISESGPTKWSTPGYGVQWNTPHQGTAGKRLTFYYHILVYDQYGPKIVDYKTPDTAPCGSVNGGAYKCAWS